MQGDGICRPTPACKQAVHNFALRHGRYLIPKFIALKRLTLELAALAPCVFRRDTSASLTVVDVGAGIHGLSKYDAQRVVNLHEDDSDALWLLSTLRESVHVHAFESNANKAAELAHIARVRPLTRDYASQLTVHAMGVAGKPGRSFVDKCGAHNTWTVQLVFDDGNNTRHSRRGCNKWRTRGDPINVTTLDEFAASELRGEQLFYVKVDVEGWEPEVAAGMRGLLRDQRIELASFEYAVGWHQLYEYATKHKNGLTDAERLASRERSLWHFQRQMGRLGYDTYLVHAGNPALGGLALLPVYGDFWHPDLEICANRSRIYGRTLSHCWNDLLVVRRSNRCLKEALFNTVLPRTVECAICPLFPRPRKRPAYRPPLPECDCL